MISPKTGDTTSWLYNPVSNLPYGNGNEFLYWDGDDWVKPINEIEVELKCTFLPTGPGKGPFFYYSHPSNKCGGGAKTQNQ